MEELSKHDKADKEYHITTNTVLNLAQRAIGRYFPNYRETRTWLRKNYFKMTIF